MCAALAERLKVEAAEFHSLENLQTFVETRANKLLLTQPKPVKIFDPEKDLAALYHELVDDPVKPISQSAAVPLRTRLDEALQAESLLQLVRRDVVVEVPSLQRPVKVPYGYQNGRFNLIQPVQFTRRSADRMTDAACKFAVEGRSLFEHPDPQLGSMQLIVVADFSSEDKEGPEAVNHLFQEYRGRMFAGQSTSPDGGATPFDLKAVNPNAKNTEDLRTPAELISVIFERGREMTAILEQLQTSDRS